MNKDYIGGAIIIGILVLVFAHYWVVTDKMMKCTNSGIVAPECE